MPRHRPGRQSISGSDLGAAGSAMSRRAGHRSKGCRSDITLGFDFKSSSTDSWPVVGVVASPAKKEPSRAGADMKKLLPAPPHLCHAFSVVFSYAEKLTPSRQPQTSSSASKRSTEVATPFLRNSTHH